MAVTPSGWPYAVPNDTLVSWPAQSQALANKLETAIGASETLDLMRVAGTPIAQQEINTGSAWQTPYGLTLVANAPFTTASTINIVNVFNATYDNYLFTLDITSASATTFGYFNFLSGTTPETSQYFLALNGYTSAGATSNIGQASVSNAYCADWGSGGAPNSATQVVLRHPFLTSQTAFITDISYDNGAGVTTRRGAGFHNVSASYNGIRFTTNTGTISGVIKIYGYRNS